MKTALPSGQSFHYIVELRPLEAVAGQYSLSISTTWAGAKVPSARRSSFQATITRDDLGALRDLIDAQVRA